MNAIYKLHKEAMDLAELAFVAKLHGNTAKSNRLLRQAYEKEAHAARTFGEQYAREPTRSVLYGSAASLALKCCEFSDAEELIAAGLAGDPPGDIKQELLELLEAVNCERGKRNGDR